MRIRATVSGYVHSVDVSIRCELYNKALMSIKCNKCGFENADGMRFCITCGARLSSPCPECGALVPPDSRYCPSCACLCGEGRFGKTQHKIEATSQTIPCPKCGTAVPSGRRFCIACGNKLEIPCPKCGSPLDLVTRYCAKCGYIAAIQ
jgi:predicted amidophosphoribosyltransferase